MKVLINTDKTYGKTCTVDSKHLHSKYNPVLEAMRNIEKQTREYQKNDEKMLSPRLLIMVGAGLGFELEALKNTYPNTPILPIYFDKILYKESAVSSKVLYAPPSYNDLRSVLQKTLRNIQLKSINQKDMLVYYWPSSANIWREYTTQSINEIKKIIEVHLAEEQTLEHFIAQWMRNACFHYLHIDTWNLPQKTENNIVVTAAGPSLNNQIKELQEKRNHYTLVSVSSALQCLFEHNLYPDVIVHQDSSYYSSQYLTNFPKSYTPLIAHPLHTSRNFLLRKYPSIILNTHQEIEGLLDIDNKTKHYVPIAPHATVLGTALELAWKLTNNSVYLAGFDLTSTPYGEHCFPHFQNKMFLQTRLFSQDMQILQKYFQTHHKVMIQNSNTYYRQNASQKMYSDWFLRWGHLDKIQRNFILSDVRYPHQTQIPITQTIRTSPKTLLPKKKKDTRIHIQSKETVGTQEKKKALYNSLADWNHLWKKNKKNKNTITTIANQKQYDENKQQNILSNLAQSISDDVFEDIIATVRKYID